MVQKIQKRYAKAIQILLFQFVDIIVVLYYIGTAICQVLLLKHARPGDGTTIFLSWALIYVLLFPQVLWYNNREKITREWIVIPCLARGWALEPLRFPAAHKNPGESQLCSDCQLVLRKSALLTGSRWIATRNVESHKFHAPSDGAVCQLCTLLHTTMQNGQDGVLSEDVPLLKGNQTQYGSIATSRASEAPFPMLLIFQPANQDGRTYLQVWESQYRFSKAFEVHQRGIPRQQISQTPPRLETHPPEERFRSTGAEYNMRMAKLWISRCSSRHPNCRPRAPSQPTRLVHISDDGKVAKIVHVGDIDTESKVPYVILSHCWGTGISYKLTTSNQEALSKDVKISDLPRNFQDAIAVTAMLGHYYIWIDSLCILQDSLDDWKVEAAKMGDVYANSVCTISATASANSQQGLFWTRDSFLDTDCTLMSSADLELYIAPVVTEQSMGMEDLFHEKVDLAPLSRRAWTFQERLLSRRILHFCDGVVLFECDVGRAAEFNPAIERWDRTMYLRCDGMQFSLQQRAALHDYYDYLKNGYRFAPMEFDNDCVGTTIEYMAARAEPLIKESARAGIRGALDMLCSLPASEFSVLEQIACHKRWYELVSEYSGRSITFRTDRLVALSGLARLIGNKSSMDYLAGLWRKTLVFDLLWEKPYPKESDERGYVAPSWSWAAVEGRTNSALLNHSRVIGASNPLRLNTEVLITVSEAVVTAGGERSSDPANLIDGGYVQLWGPAKSVCLADFPFTLDFTIPGGAELETEFVCLAVYSEFEKKDLSGVWWGLLLQHVDDAPPDVYERCGIVTVHGVCRWPGEEGWWSRQLVII